MRCIVLHVKEGRADGWMPLYAAQVATIQDYDTLEQGATFNVGSHPEAQKLGKPYRVIVIPEEHWHEFEVHSNRVLGHDEFVAVPSTDRTIS